MTPYQVQAYNLRALQADRASVLDPGSGGTVRVNQTPALLQIDSAGARTLEAAANLPVGASVFAFATVSGASVNSHTLADGGWVEFKLVLNASAAKAWVVYASSAAQDALASADFSTAPQEITGDLSTYNETAFKAVLTALAAYGLLTDSTTT